MKIKDTSTIMSKNVYYGKFVLKEIYTEAMELTE